MATDYASCMAEIGDEAYCRAQYPGGDGGGDGGATTLALNTVLQDQAGNPWQVVQLGTAGTRRFGLRSLSGIQSPVGSGDWALYGVIQNVSPYFLNQAGRAIELNPDGTFRELTINETGNLFPSGGGGGGGGGGSYAAPSYMSTQPAQAAQFQHDLDLTDKNAELAEAKAVGDHERARELELEILGLQQTFQDEQRLAGEEFQAEQNRLAEEAALKQSRLGVLQNLVQGFLDKQQRASEFVLSMQPNPFRFAAAAGNLPVLGTTPQEGYTEALTEFAQRPAPVMDPNAPLSAIEGGIESIMGQRFPLQPNVFGGMSGGGTVPMGASGTFLVGEKGPEVMDVSPSGVTVRPLSGGFAYGGGVDFDASSIHSALAPLYASLGFRGMPTATLGAKGLHIGGKPGMGRLETLKALGIKPHLVRDYETGAVFYIDPETGLRQHISAGGFAESGFRWSDVINMAGENIRTLSGGRGAPITSTAPYEYPPPGTWGPMSTMNVPAIEPTTNYLLPAPYRVASERRRLAATNPQLYDIGTYAYDYPNSPIMPGALRTAEDIFTPRGGGRYPIGFR